MSLHRVCCCGDGAEGACGFVSADVLVCDGNTQVPANAFIPGRSISYNGEKRWVRTFDGGGGTTLTEVIESGIIGFAYQFGRQPTDAEILADNPSLGSFAVVEFTGSSGGPVSTSDGSNVGIRRFWGYNLDSLTGERILATQTVAVWRVNAFPFNCQPLANQTQSVTGDGANYNQRITFDGFGFSDVQTYTLAVTLHRDIRELPSYWAGSPSFDVCSIPAGFGQVFQPRPPEATTTGTDVNASAIEAMQANDPLRTCRGCGG